MQATQPADHDEALYLAHVVGDEDALSALVERYHTRIFAVAKRITACSEAAADITQEIWLKLAAKPSVSGGFRKWLFAKARWRSLDWLRSKYRDISTLEDAEDYREQPAESRLEHAELKASLRQLPHALMEPIHLVYIVGLSVPLAAKTAGLPERTFRSRLSKAIYSLRQIA